MLKMVKLEFETHKNQYFSWLLRSEQVKTNIFGNRMTNWPFKIGLSLFDFKQLLVDSGIIVHCDEQSSADHSTLKLFFSYLRYSRNMNCRFPSHLGSRNQMIKIPTHRPASITADDIAVLEEFVNADLFLDALLGVWMDA